MGPDFGRSKLVLVEIRAKITGENAHNCDDNASPAICNFILQRMCSAFKDLHQMTILKALERHLGRRASPLKHTSSHNRMVYIRSLGQTDPV